MRRILSGLFAFALVAQPMLVAARRQQPQPPSQQSPPPVKADEQKAQQPSGKTYDALLDRLKKGERTIDFREFRMAYTETAAYSPYGKDEESRKAMFAALRAKDWDKVLQNAGKILAKSYVDIYAHYASHVAMREKGDAPKADFHKYVFDGLLKSIMGAFDGKSVETAFVVISTDEEYVFLNFAGLQPAGQALINDKGHSYDKMTAIDPQTKQKHEFYFNIDKPFGWLGDSLKKNK